MIAITTDNGTLRIAGELPIPNGQNWSPGRIQRLMMEIERYVFTSELVDKDLPKSNGRCNVSALNPIVIREGRTDTQLQPNRAAMPRAKL